MNLVKRSDFNPFKHARSLARTGREAGSLIEVFWFFFICGVGLLIVLVPLVILGVLYVLIGVAYAIRYLFLSIAYALKGIFRCLRWLYRSARHFLHRRTASDEELKQSTVTVNVDTVPALAAALASPSAALLAPAVRPAAWPPPASPAPAVTTSGSWPTPVSPGEVLERGK